MKKGVIIVLAVAMLISIAACTKSGKEEKTTAETSTKQEETIDEKYTVTVNLEDVFDDVGDTTGSSESSSTQAGTTAAQTTTARSDTTKKSSSKTTTYKSNDRYETPIIPMN